MGLILDEFTIDGAKLDPDVTDRVRGARLIGRDKGAMSLELTIWDGDWSLRREGKLASARRPKKTPFKQASWARYGESRMIFDGILFRLADVDFPLGSPNVRLTWDDESAALARRHTREITVSRGSKTRAGTIGMAFDRIKEIAVPYRSPEENIRQNQETVDEDQADGKGFPDGVKVTIKGAKATREQLKNLTTALEVADRLKAGERATLALITAGTTESQWLQKTEAESDADSSGVLQVQKRTADNIKPRTEAVYDPISGRMRGGGTATPRDEAGPIAPGSLDPLDIKEVVRLFLIRGYAAYRGGAIKYAAENPEAEIYEIAQAQQGSGTGRATNGQANYGPWVEEAKAILDAWGGTGEVTVLRESFEFRIGGKEDPDDKNEKPENYWAGANRLGNELDGWQLWSWRNQINFISDEWLFRRKPVLRIGPEHVIPAHRDPERDALKPFWQIGYRAASGSAIQEVRFAGPSRRWDYAPGSVILLDDLGDLDGRWLLSEHDFDLQRDVGTFTVRRPMEKQPEPAPKTRTVTTTETREQESGTPRDRILKVLDKAMSDTWRTRYRYLMARPYPPSLFPVESVSILQIDCSSFVTLVYKAAGIADPNGAGYNGGGNTSTLRANGKKTTDPQPGDLVHWGSGAAGGASHVGIYVGKEGGKPMCVDMSSSRNLSKREIWTSGSPPFAGYWQHDLADA